MDTVKYGRIKIKVGDCVSVPSNYFGTDYEAALQTNGLTAEKLGSQMSSGETALLWYDGMLRRTKQRCPLPKLLMEDVNTPIQEVETQGSSETAAQSHAILVENIVFNQR